MLLGFRDALEAIEQGLRVEVLGIVELDLVLLGAIFKAKGFGSQIGDLQAGFQGMLEVVELVGESENLVGVAIG